MMQSWHRLLQEGLWPHHPLTSPNRINDCSAGYRRILGNSLSLNIHFCFGIASWQTLKENSLSPSIMFHPVCGLYFNYALGLQGDPQENGAYYTKTMTTSWCLRNRDTSQSGPSLPGAPASLSHALWVSPCAFLSPLMGCPLTLRVPVLSQLGHACHADLLQPNLTSWPFPFFTLLITSFVSPHFPVWIHKNDS